MAYRDEVIPRLEILNKKWPGDNIELKSLTFVPTGVVAVYKRVYDGGVAEYRMCFIDSNNRVYTDMLARRT